MRDRNCQEDAFLLNGEKGPFLEDRGQDLRLSLNESRQ
jgi:hypothetical protein